jgi:hypothetical protein
MLVRPVATAEALRVVSRSPPEQLRRIRSYGHPRASIPASGHPMAAPRWLGEGAAHFTVKSTVARHNEPIRSHLGARAQILATPIHVVT